MWVFEKKKWNCQIKIFEELGISSHRLEITRWNHMFKHWFHLRILNHEMKSHVQNVRILDFFVGILLLKQLIFLIKFRQKVLEFVPPAAYAWSKGIYVNIVLWLCCSNSSKMPSVHVGSFKISTFFKGSTLVRQHV